MSLTPKRHRTTTLAVGVLAAALALSGCSSSAPGVSASESTNSETRPIEADNGTVEVPADPQRIVTIGNATLPLMELGGKPVGVTFTPDISSVEAVPEQYRATFEAAEIIGNSGGEVDLEKLANLKPDLVIAQFDSSDWDQVGAKLESVAPTVYFGLRTEWKALANSLAEASNLTGGLSEQKAAFEKEVAEIRDTYADVIEKDSFVDITRGDWMDPGTFAIQDIGCSEVALADVGMDYAAAPEGEDPLAWTSLPFEQLTELSKYDVITYPIDADGNPTEEFRPVIETNTWKALPAVTSGNAIGVYCGDNNSYGGVLEYLDSLENALATLPAPKE